MFMNFRHVQHMFRRFQLFLICFICVDVFQIHPKWSGMHRGGRGSGRQPLNQIEMAIYNTFYNTLFIPSCITIVYWIAYWIADWIAYWGLGAWESYLQSGKAKTVRQAKDRCQASKGQRGKQRTVGRQAKDSQASKGGSFLISIAFPWFLKLSMSNSRSQ